MTRQKSIAPIKLFLKILEFNSKWNGLMTMGWVKNACNLYCGSSILWFFEMRLNLCALYRYLRWISNHCVVICWMNEWIDRWMCIWNMDWMNSCTQTRNNTRNYQNKYVCGWELSGIERERENERKNKLQICSERDIDCLLLPLCMSYVCMGTIQMDTYSRENLVR